MKSFRLHTQKKLKKTSWELVHQKKLRQHKHDALFGQKQTKQKNFSRRRCFLDCNCTDCDWGSWAKFFLMWKHGIMMEILTIYGFEMCAGIVMVSESRSAQPKTKAKIWNTNWHGETSLRSFRWAHQTLHSCSRKVKSWALHKRIYYANKVRVLGVTKQSKRRRVQRTAMHAKWNWNQRGITFT